MVRWLVIVAVAAWGGGNGGECAADFDRSGSDVCARNGECLPPSQVRSVHVTWTIRGAPASATNCAPTPSFYVLFASPQVNDTYGYEPVPCESGLFTVDKLPRRFVSVEI